MAKSIYTRRHQRLRDLLIDARQSADLTQQEVAHRIGKPQSYIAKIEGGERRLDVIELIELCDQLGADPSNIIRGLQKVS
jgi:transcriptional regulator with XRE-family HTH domain